MALLALLPSTPVNAEASQIISTVNALIAAINVNTGLGGVAQGTNVANGSVAVTVTSLGPTGSHTTIQEWLTWVNPAGVTRYIPLF